MGNDLVLRRRDGFSVDGDGVLGEHRVHAGLPDHRDALVFHPENVSLDEDVYVGHYAILKGYFRNELVVGRGAWIGQAAFLHAAGGIRIGSDVGIGPHVCIFNSARSTST